MRFPEFGGEWEREKLRDKCSFYSGGTPSSSNKLYYNGEIPFIRSGEISGDSTELFLSEFGLNNSSAKMVDIGDLLLALYGATSGQISISKIRGAINQAILCIKSSYDNIFLKSVWEKHVDKILQAYLQGGQGNLSADIVKNLSFYFPSLDEQNKISKLIVLIDERIATQNKIIEQLQSLIKGIRVRLFSFDNYDIKYLGDLCSITTGKLDANAMVENGKYPFFTCAEDTFRIDEYAFDTEALLISGNGANLGYIHYYNGKFNAYQRTYVLDKFSVEVMYLKYYLETFLNQRINQEVNVGNTPYIVLSTLTKMKIKIPDISQQRNIINVLSNLNLKLNQEKDILSAYQTQKAYLLRNLFT